MKNFWEWISDIKIGQKWTMERIRNPFISDSDIVTIVDIKRGYVKYQYSFGGYNNKSISSFILIYHKYE